MANYYYSKSRTKLLKGEIQPISATFDTINVTTLNIDSNVFSNVTIKDSYIINTPIGVGGPNIGIFTTLEANDFYLYGSDPDYYVSWDSNTNVFNINGSLEVHGCSYFDNIEICENTISSINTNGNINLIPNGHGNINITSGGFNANIISGGGFLVNASYISIGSHISDNINKSKIDITSLNDINISTINGDLNLLTKTSDLKQISTITQINSNTYELTSILPHNLKQGDEIEITNVEPLFDSNYLVNYIDSYNITFTTDNILINPTNGSLGSFERINNNNINLNAGKYVNIPLDIHLNFGNENSYIMNSNNNLVITSDTNVIIDGDLTTINTTNVKITDPIVTLADYTLVNNDNLDRGIEFRYLNTSSSFLQTLGWFGYKNELNAFTFITNATNNNEIITGDIGDFVVNNININGEIIFNGSVFDIGCGQVINVSKLIGCNNILTIEGNNVINLTSASINLNAQNTVNIPVNVNLNIGSVGNISSDLTNFKITSQEILTILSSSGNIYLNTLNGDICLYPSQGNVRIPEEIALIFSTNTTINSIICSDGGLIVSGGDVNNFNIENFERIYLDASQFVHIPSNVKLQFGDDMKYIYSNNDDLKFISTIGSIIINSNVCEINTTDRLLIDNFTTNMNINDVYISCANYVIGGNNNPISTTFINTTFLNITDPIINIGYSNNTIEDKGIQYNYNLSSLGWFGVKTNTNRFTFYDSAINTNNIITGHLGDMELNNIYVNGLYLNGDLDLSCHNLLNAKIITACSDDNEIVISSGNIILSALNTISIPDTTLLTFGTNGNMFYSDTSGNLNVNSNNTVVINGNLQVNGTTLNVYSTITNIQDPIISIGGVVGPLVNDAKDRGVEFKWFSNGTSKIGFFGYQNRSDRFVFIPDGTNIYEVFYGAYGDVQFGNGYFYNLDVNLGGDITGVNNIYGNTSGNILVISSGNIHLDGNTLIPYDNFLYIGSTTNSIYSSADNMVISTTILNLSSESINLSSESINIPETTPIVFGNTSGQIYGENSQLYILGDQSINISSGTIELSGDVNIDNNINYSVERYVLNSFLQNKNPSLDKMVTFVSVDGVSLDTYGTLGNLNLSDGQIKTILCSQMGNNCTYTIYVGSGKLIAPNAGNNINASILKFTRAGQSIQLIFDATLEAWLVIGRGCAIY